MKCIIFILKKNSFVLINRKNIFIIFLTKGTFNKDSRAVCKELVDNGGEI